MAMIGTCYLVYVMSHAFREVAECFVDADDYGAIYAVTSSSHTPEMTKPSRAELDAAHWAMFLTLVDELPPELKALAEARGFDACWNVHRLDIESGEDMVSDALGLRG